MKASSGAAPRSRPSLACGRAASRRVRCCASSSSSVRGAAEFVLRLASLATSTKPPAHAADDSLAMATLHFLRSVIELAAIESVDVLLDEALPLLERELGQRARIELWDYDGTRLVRGDAIDERAHCTWIGIHYTLGAIQLPTLPSDAEAVRLLAGQLALIGERLFAALPRR